MRYTSTFNWIVVIELLTVWMVPGALGSDLPLIAVSREGLVPEQIEVHVGEVVRWRDAKGIRIRLEFDPHCDAHEVIERPEEIRAIFRLSDQHWYVASIVGDGHRHVRGVVTVREAERPVGDLPLCSWESSARLCFEP